MTEIPLKIRNTHFLYCVALDPTESRNLFSLAVLSYKEQNLVHEAREALKCDLC